MVPSARFYEIPHGKPRNTTNHSVIIASNLHFQGTLRPVWHVGDVVGVESGGIVESGAGVQDEEGAAGTLFNRKIAAWVTA